MSCGRRNWTAEELSAFERRIADRFLAKEIHAPVHLSGGNEEELINIFKKIQPGDWVLSTHRSHYHALLHGISLDWVEAEILAGRSMHLNSPEHHFLTSAIVGGIAPIAVGIAMGLKRDGRAERVWCFLGDMAGHMGVVLEAVDFTLAHVMNNVTFVVEDNGFSAETPTSAVWGDKAPFPLAMNVYTYKRQWPHVGVGQWVTF